MSDGGKGAERLHGRTKISHEEMAERWEQTFGNKIPEHVKEIIDEVNEKYDNALKELAKDD